jgi:hypothetical protein
LYTVRCFHILDFHSFHYSQHQHHHHPGIFIRINIFHHVCDSTTLRRCV